MKKVLMGCIIAVCVGMQSLYAMDILVVNALKSSDGSLDTPRDVDKCPVCLQKLDYTIEHGEEKVVVTTCGHSFHTQCLDGWEAAIKKQAEEQDKQINATCPTCRSGEQNFALKEDITCSLCGERSRPTDKIISFHCKLSGVGKAWNEKGSSRWGLYFLSALYTAATDKDEIITTDHFHENCLRDYYENEKKGHDIQFRNKGAKEERVIVFYCPIHKKLEVHPPFEKDPDIKLANQSMTDEELTKFLEDEVKQKEFELANRLSGGL